MNVEALDHVNIITDRLDETAQFYGHLLGLERRDAPPPLTPQTATWMFDAEGRAIIHINSLDCYRTYDREVSPGSLTGALHHVALTPSFVDPRPEITPDPARADGTWGVALLSRLPVLAVREVELGRAVERWDVAARPAILADVELDDRYRAPLASPA